VVCATRFLLGDVEVEKLHGELASNFLDGNRVFSNPITLESWRREGTHGYLVLIL